MERTKRPVSKVKMVLMWLIFLGLTAGWIAFLLSRHRDTPVSTQPAPDLIRTIITLIIGGFFFVAGVGSYFILLATDCFTFNFQRPVWDGVKGKLYVESTLASQDFRPQSAP